MIHLQDDWKMLSVGITLIQAMAAGWVALMSQLKCSIRTIRNHLWQSSLIQFAQSHRAKLILALFAPILKATSRQMRSHQNIKQFHSTRSRISVFIANNTISSMSLISSHQWIASCLIRCGINIGSTHLGALGYWAMQSTQQVKFLIYQRSWSKASRAWVVDISLLLRLVINDRKISWQKLLATAAEPPLNWFMA